MTFPAFSMKIQRACKIIDKKREKFVLLHGENGTSRVSVSNIYYIEVADHLLTYHTTTGDYRVFGVLKNLEEQLGDSFVHCFFIAPEETKKILYQSSFIIFGTACHKLLFC